MKTKSAIFSIVLVFLTISCSKYKDGYQKSITIQIVPDGVVNIQNPNFTVTLYGVDPVYQDVPATKIVSKNYSKNSLPASIKLDIPNNADGMIEYKNENTEKAYYLDIEWDANDNNQYDKGDVVIHFDKKFPDIDLKKRNHTVYVHHWQ